MREERDYWKMAQSSAEAAEDIFEKENLEFLNF